MRGERGELMGMAVGTGVAESRASAVGERRAPAVGERRAPHTATALALLLAGALGLPAAAQEPVVQDTAAADSAALDTADVRAAQEAVAALDTASLAQAPPAFPLDSALLAASPNGDRFLPLELPAPTPQRAADGSPGPEYWQQRADYRLRARLDPSGHRLEGEGTIRYTNLSPDTLRSLWVQLDQNLFDPESREAQQMPDTARFSGAFEGGGYRRLTVGVTQEGERRTLELAPGDPGDPAASPGAAEREAPAGYRVRGTVMEVVLPRPLPPRGGTLELHLAWAFTIPENGADRMGRQSFSKGRVYQLAQWYPRVFVYDDVRGWNVLPYLGQGEFYLEYGDFEVEITVPRDMFVFATGVLQNPEDVLTVEQRERLERARESERTVTVVGREEVGRSSTRPAGSGPLTWRFRAEEVRDFAWAASRAFIWDAAGWEGVLIMSAYPEEGLGQGAFYGWERSTEIVRHSVAFYSRQWHRYPYPVAINVAGRPVGMEYPMIVFCTWQARGSFMFQVTDHEVAHAWFPMLVGSDERRHAWMDEGLVTFMGHDSERAFTGQTTGSSAMSARRLGPAMRDAERPVMSFPDSIPEDELGLLAYDAPGGTLLALRDAVLGPARFEAAFRAYIDRWAYRHPQPADFFRTMESVGGMELAWFWRSWILRPASLDQAVRRVWRVADTVFVTVENRGEAVMPLNLRVTYEDGSTERRSFPVTVWLRGDSLTARVVREGAPALRNVAVDPDVMLPDVNRANNVFGRGITGSGAGAFLRRGPELSWYFLGRGAPRPHP